MGEIRTFNSGATRDTEEGKFDYEGFLSPWVLERYAMYMHQHRKQSDGALRDSDNWQKGIPRTAYIKSLFRHFMDLWKLHRLLWVMNLPRSSADQEALEDALCAIIFNTSGYLHEELKP